MNDIAIEWLKQNTTITDDIVRGNKFINIWCAPYNLNLIMVEGLKEVDKLVLKVQNLVKYVKVAFRGLANSRL